MSLPNLPLISAQQLFQHLEQENPTQERLMILDASMPPIGSMKAPEFGWPDTVIGNARRMDIEAVFSDNDAQYPHTMLSPDAFEHACQLLGINNDHHIVVYDNLGMFSSARTWWMLKAMGHQNVSVLDGGLPYWLQSNLPTQQANIETPPRQGDFVSRFQTRFFCDADSVAHALNSQSKLVLDARAANRFYGEVPEPRAGVRSGHMPGAMNLPYADLFEHGLMKTSGQLQKIFQKLNVNNQPLVMSCGSGITACILALAATIAEQQEISVYDGSWSEWGSDLRFAVETGKR
ncbi:sulfurtransferase [Colwellia sp. MEBiC06753]